jgi:prepilin peptidase CpaA
MVTTFAAIATPLGLLTLCLATVGSGTDLRTRRIPNWLTVGAFALALAVRGVGAEPVMLGLTGAGVAFLVALPLFLVRAIGAGDVKYLAAFGAVLGLDRIGVALVLVAIAGGVLALVNALYQRRLTSLISSSAQLALYSASMGFLGSRRTLTDTPQGGETAAVPLGVAIAIGSVLVWFI